MLVVLPRLGVTAVHDATDSNDMICLPQNLLQRDIRQEKLYRNRFFLVPNQGSTLDAFATWKALGQ